MKNNSFAFRRIVAVATVVYVVVVSAVLAFFHAQGTDASQTFLFSGGIGIVFIVLAAIILGKSAKTYSTDFKRIADNTEQSKASLNKLASAPLQGLILTVFLDLIYLAVIFLLAGQIGLQESSRLPIFFLLTSLGMLASAFVFVLADRLGTDTLLSQNLVHYPLDLRDKRQQRKNFIIPTFMTFMTFIFAFAIAALLVDRLNAAQGSSGDVFLMAGGLSLFFFVIVIVLVLLWTATTALIYRSVIVQLEHLSAAEKDLTGRISIGSVDELGSIAGMVNYFCVGLLKSVDNLKRAQTKLTSLGEELEHGADDTAGAVAQIFASTERVREKTEVQVSSVAESAHIVDQIAQNIGNLENLISSQAASLSEASASIEEMVGNIASVTNSIDKMAQQFTTLLTAAQEGKTLQATSRAKVEEIAKSSAALLEANKVISTIASQTNLLAMNAAIEAAHAGDAGKGFSVVADEVRRLAETSTAQSKVIRTELTQVQTSIEEVVTSSRDSEKSFEQVVERIGETDALVREVHLAMLEQKEGSVQVLEALKVMNEITSQVKTSSLEMSAGNKTVQKEIDKLKDAAAEIKTNMDEMAAGTSGIAESTKKVAAMAKDTQATIQVMDEAVGHFKIE